MFTRSDSKEDEILSISLCRSFFLNIFFWFDISAFTSITFTKSNAKTICLFSWLKLYGEKEETKYHVEYE